MNFANGPDAELREYLLGPASTPLGLGTGLGDKEMTASDPTPKTSLVLRGSMLRLSKQTVESKAVMKRRRFWRGSCWGEPPPRGICLRNKG